MIGLAAGALTLSACGGPKHFNEEHAKYDPSLSKAMNLALLTGLTTMEGPLKDSKPVKSVEPTTDPTKAIGAASSAALMAAQSTGTMLDAGMGIGGSMGMSGLSLLTSLSGTKKSLYEYNHIVAFMPKGIANDSRSATIKLAAFIEQALYKVKEYSFQKDESGVYYKIQGGNCDNLQCSINFSYPLPDVGDMHTWAFKQGDYIWGNATTNIPFGLGVLDNISDRNHLPLSKALNSEKLLLDFSSNLPSWCFLYIAYDAETKTLPHFLNQGKVLYFAAPKIN